MAVALSTEGFVIAVLESQTAEQLKPSMGWSEGYRAGADS